MKITIAKKLSASYILIYITLAIIIVTSLINMQSMQKATNDIVLDAIPLGNAADELLTHLVDEETGVRGYLVSGDEKFLEPYEIGSAGIEESLKVIDIYLDNHPIMAELISEAKPKIAKIEEYFESQIALVKAGKIEEARSKVGDGKQLFDSYRETHSKIKEDIDKLTNDAWNITKQIRKSTFSQFLVTGVVVIIIILLIAFYLIKSISTPIKTVTKNLERIANGDLTLDVIKVKNKDEVGSLIDSVNSMVKDLHSAITKVNEAIMQISASSEELTASAEQSSKANESIAYATSQSSEGAENQRNSVNTVSSSIEQMTARIQQIAMNSEQMSELSFITSEATKAGIKSVSTVVKQMNDISETVEDTEKVIISLRKRSDEIIKMVDIITDITEQTNLLSLNAAIEAARAGESGKGFAVVAEEIRKLAENSKESAQQITTFVLEIQEETEKAVTSINIGTEKVKSGLDSTQEVNETFSKIDNSVIGLNEKINLVSESINKISSDGNEIMNAIEVVSKAAEDGATLNEENLAATEEQLATMEEIASSAQALSSLAEDLSTTIMNFKL